MHSHSREGSTRGRVVQFQWDNGIKGRHLSFFCNRLGKQLRRRGPWWGPSHRGERGLLWRMEQFHREDPSRVQIINIC